MKYVKEIDRELSDFEYDVWMGKGLNPNLCAYYKDKWIKEYNDRMHPTISIITIGPIINLPAQNNRMNRCEHLGHRVEFRTGCGGWGCLHACGKGLVAIPGKTCQTCSEYKDSGDKFQ